MTPERKTTITGRTDGFSLIEILTVVMIIAVLAAASGGIYIGAYKKQIVEKSARQLLLAAKYARTIAIEQQTSCELALDKTKQRFCLYLPKGDEETGQMVNTVITDSYSKPTELGKNVTFEKIAVVCGECDEKTSDTAQTITFYADGSADAAVVQIGDGKRHYCLSIAAATGTGRLTTGRADEAKSDVIDLDKLATGQ